MLLVAIIFFLSLQTAFEDDRLSWLPSSAQQFLPRMTGMGRDVYMVPKQMYFFKNHRLIHV